MGIYYYCRTAPTLIDNTTSMQKSGHLLYIRFLNLYEATGGVLKNNLSRDATTINCNFSRPDDLRTRSRKVYRVTSGEKVLFKTVRLGARVPRAAVGAADFKKITATITADLPTYSIVDLCAIMAAALVAARVLPIHVCHARGEQGIGGGPGRSSGRRGAP
jgi:hypothetical protein